MRQRPAWEAYERLAADGEYGPLLNQAGELALPADGEKEAAFFRATLGGRKRVLDVGCGPGFPSVALAEVAGGICGVDASGAMLASAQRNIAALGIGNIYLVRALGEALPFAESSFDGFAVCGTLGSLLNPQAVLSELCRVATPGALAASIEWDFRSRVPEGGPRAEHWLRRGADWLELQVVRYMIQPYLIRTERYTLDPCSDLGRRLIVDLELAEGGRKRTELSPDEVPGEALLDACYEEEAQFDPETLRDAFVAAGFEVLEQRVAASYGVSHIFSVFRRG